MISQSNTQVAPGHMTQSLIMRCTCIELEGQGVLVARVSFSFRSVSFGVLFRIYFGSFHVIELSVVGPII